MQKKWFWSHYIHCDLRKHSVSSPQEPASRASASYFLFNWIISESDLVGHRDQQYYIFNFIKSTQLVRNLKLNTDKITNFFPKVCPLVNSIRLNAVYTSTPRNKQLSELLDVCHQRHLRISFSEVVQLFRQRVKSKRPPNPPVRFLDVIVGAVLVKAEHLVQSLAWRGQGSLSLFTHVPWALPSHHIYYK